MLGFDTAGGIEALRAQVGLGAVLAILPAHCIITVTPVGELVPWGLANGMLFGVGLGALFNWLAWMGATLVQFGIGRQLTADFEAAEKMQRFPRWLRRLPVDHPFVLICGRWFPMGTFIVNIGAAARGVALRRVLGCAAVGYIPQSLFVAAVGAGLVSLW